MHEGLWEQIERLQPAETATRTRCTFSVQDGQTSYTVRMLNVDYTVNVSRRSIQPMAGRYAVKQPGYLEQLCMLAYLLHAKEKPLSHRLVGEKGLPGGSFYFQAKPHELPTGLLATALEARPETLYAIIDRFNATRCDLGDACIRVPVLPRLPLTIVIWRADDEFPGRRAVRRHRCRSAPARCSRCGGGCHDKGDCRSRCRSEGLTVNDER